ncbi:lantibiotic modifying enzyme domain protein [Mycobacterium kansasii]|uniref:Lantibiotic modifying enzyme domain protein n=1 Tax=Mycobacterium kansasii TaxID=1768 RepID=A0A1V3XT61_MYCKA|nr:lantibiotic modifying enzyme domain protein [Mycobacterium kansasii]
MPSDTTDIRDVTGISVHATGVSGMGHALALAGGLDGAGIEWQVTIIRQNMESFARGRISAEAVGPEPTESPDVDGVPTTEMFRCEADRIAEDLSRYAIRRGRSAAWIALDWLGDSELFQLICLGPGLYNGVSGIGVFLAAHAAVTGCARSGNWRWPDWPTFARNSTAATRPASPGRWESAPVAVWDRLSTRLP